MFKCFSNCYNIERKLGIAISALFKIKEGKVEEIINYNYFMGRFLPSCRCQVL